MPGPNIINRKTEERRAAASERKTYYLTDPHCTSIHGVDVTDEVRENGLVLTASEAMTLVASGAVTTDKAAADKAAEEMQAGVDKLAEQRQAAAQAAAEKAEADGAAAIHNAGEGTYSKDEVEAKMAAPPSAEKTWADQQAAG